ncbi:3-hydroxyacyl-CoA dehydrogenase NAD-binding domain-containing protein, partial [uncultured Bifidobacterium sp.]
MDGVRDDVHVIANIGSGTMGHATALQFAWHGYPVRMLDVSD